MTQTAALHHLQTLDSQVDAARRRLAEIDRQLGEDKAVQQAQARRDKVSTTLRRWRTRLTDLELERQRLRQEAEGDEQRLYSGKVHNPRELTDLQNKVAELQRRGDDLDEPILEAMLKIEAGEEALEQAEAALEAATAEQADTAGELVEERRQLMAQLEALEQQIAPARAAVEPQHLATYDRLRRRPGGVAVAELTASGACALCGMQATSSMQQRVRRGEVLTCPTCSRILYHP